MPKGATDGSIQRELKGKCLECGREFLRPWVGHMCEENTLGDEAGFDVMAYCSEVCEDFKLKLLFAVVKADPGQMFNFVGGLNIAKNASGKNWKKKSKSATA